MDCSLSCSSVHGILQSRILEWVAIPFSRGFPNPGIEPKSPALQADSLPSEPPGKAKNTGVGNLSFLQWIFPTQVKIIFSTNGYVKVETNKSQTFFSHHTQVT